MCRRGQGHWTLSVCVFKNVMFCFDPIGERSRVVTVCASLPHLRSSEESRFFSAKQTQDSYLGKDRKPGKSDRKMFVP